MDTKTDGKANLNNEAATLRRVSFFRAAGWLCLQVDGDVWIRLYA